MYVSQFDIPTTLWHKLQTPFTVPRHHSHGRTRSLSQPWVRQHGRAPRLDVRAQQASNFASLVLPHSSAPLHPLLRGTPKGYRCPICFKSEHTRSLLAEHVVRHQPGPSRQACIEVLCFGSPHTLGRPYLSR